MCLSTFWFWYPRCKEPTGGLTAVVRILLSGESLAVAAWPSAGSGALNVRPSSLGTWCPCQKGTGEGGRWGSVFGQFTEQNSQSSFEGLWSKYNSWTGTWILLESWLNTWLKGLDSLVRQDSREGNGKDLKNSTQCMRKLSSSFISARTMICLL